MDKAALEEAVRLAADTERMAAADYRREIAELDATGVDQLTPKGRVWVVAYYFAALCHLVACRHPSTGMSDSAPGGGRRCLCSPQQNPLG